MVSLDLDHSIRPVFKKTSCDAPETEAAANHEDSLFELCLEIFYPGNAKDRRGLKLLLERESPALFTERGMLDWLKLMKDYNDYIPDPQKPDAPENTRALWNARELALLFGYGGLEGGQTFKYLLFTRGEIKPTLYMQSAPLDERMIVVHALKYFRKHGKLPGQNSGDIEGLPGETWKNFQGALHTGSRGLEAIGGLNNLYIKYGLRLGDLTEEIILRHALAHYKKHGKLPGQNSGLVDGLIGETWRSWDMALRKKFRGLTGEDMSLDRLYIKKGLRLGDLTEEIILRHARAHLEKHGAPPTQYTGVVDGLPGETWGAWNVALQNNYRGLTGDGITLEKFFIKHGLKLGDLDENTILELALNHLEKHGKLPTKASGVMIDEYPGEKWLVVDASLRHGWRTLPGGSSLAQLYEKHNLRDWEKKFKKGEVSVAFIRSQAIPPFEKTCAAPEIAPGEP